MKYIVLLLLATIAFSAKVTVTGITCGACTAAMSSCTGQTGTGTALKCLATTINGAAQQVCYSGHTTATATCSSYPSGSVTFESCTKDYKGSTCTSGYCFLAHGSATNTAASATQN